MSDRGRAAAARAIKRNGAKKTRQQGGKIVRDAVDAMHAEQAEVTTAKTAQTTEEAADMPEAGAEGADA